jgi:hypothetical protein
LLHQAKGYGADDNVTAMVIYQGVSCSNVS